MRKIPANFFSLPKQVTSATLLRIGCDLRSNSSGDAADTATATVVGATTAAKGAAWDEELPSYMVVLMIFVFFVGQKAGLFSGAIVHSSQIGP